MENSIGDSRYSIGLEFTGDDEQMFVLRFCGDWVAKFNTVKGAEVAAVTHSSVHKHKQNHTKWQLVTECEGVLWLQTRKSNRVIYRVAYGADIKDTLSATEATGRFGDCVRHSVECKGLLGL